MNTTLPRFLLRLGRGLGQRSRIGGLRTVALAVSCGVLAVGLLVLGIGVQQSHARQERAAALLPIEATHAGEAKLLFKLDLPSLKDPHGVVRNFTVIWLSPLTSDAPLPAGLKHWPKPGEAVLSPQAAEDLTGHFSGIFGKPVGTIDPSFLEVPNERRIYARPLAGAVSRSAMTAISGFGPTGMRGMWGTGTLYAAATSDLVMVPLLFMIAPGLIGVAAAAGLGAAARQRRASQLVGLGAGRGQLALVDLGESWFALAAGALAAGSGWFVLGVTGLRLNLVDFSLPAATVRDRWPLGGALIVCGALAAALTVVAMGSWQRRGRRRAGRSAREPQRPPTTRALVCIAAGIATIWLPLTSRSGVFRTLSYHLGILVVMFSLPSLLAVILAVLGRVVVRTNRRVGSAGVLLAGRRLSVFPRRWAWKLAGLTGAILLFGQVQLNASTLDSTYADAVAGQQRYGDVVLALGQPSYDARQDAFLRSLPTGVGSVWTVPTTTASGASGPTTIIASCPTLTVLGLACTPGKVGPGADSRDTKAMGALRVAVNGLDSGTRLVTAAPGSWSNRRLARATAGLSLVSLTGHDLPLDTLWRDANRYMVGGFDISPVGEEWIASGTSVRTNRNWIILWSIVGLAALTVVSAAVLGADGLAATSETAALAAMSDRRRWLLALASLQGGLPVLLAGVVSAGAYLTLPIGVSIPANGTVFVPSSFYAWSVVAVTTLVAIALTIWTSASTITASRRWYPGRDLG